MQHCGGVEGECELVAAGNLPPSLLFPFPLPLPTAFPCSLLPCVRSPGPLSVSSPHFSPVGRQIRSLSGSEGAVASFSSKLDPYLCLLSFPALGQAPKCWHPPYLERKQSLQSKTEFRTLSIYRNHLKTRFWRVPGGHCCPSVSTCPFFAQPHPQV